VVEIPDKKSMRATLSFNLDDGDDQRAHMRCVKSLDMALFIWELKCNLRKRMFRESDIRGESDGKDYEPGVTLAWEMLDELLEESNINVDDLII
jgi:hypothetical protein